VITDFKTQVWVVGALSRNLVSLLLLNHQHGVPTIGWVFNAIQGKQYCTQFIFY
jgi:hypothetical protein